MPEWDPNSDVTFELIAGILKAKINPAATPEVAGLTIGGKQPFEAGSNANGSWLRFPTLGVQICWNDLATVLTTTIASGSVYISNAVSWTFPQEFAARPVVIPAMRYGGSSGGAWGRVAGTPTATDAPMSAVGATATYTGILTPVAIGTYTP